MCVCVWLGYGSRWDQRGSHYTSNSTWLKYVKLCANLRTNNSRISNTRSHNNVKKSSRYFYLPHSQVVLRQSNEEFHQFPIQICREVIKINIAKNLKSIVWITKCYRSAVERYIETHIRHTSITLWRRERTDIVCAR